MGAKYIFRKNMHSSIDVNKVNDNIRPGLDMAGLLGVEGELAELSVSRTKDNLEKELEWTKLCKTRFGIINLLDVEMLETFLLLNLNPNILLWSVMDQSKPGFCLIDGLFTKKFEKHSSIVVP